MKTILFFIVVIAAVGFFVYKYFEDEECPRSPVTNECMGTSTGYEQMPTGGGGGAPIQVPTP
jgi:hypothetical protein